MFLKRRLAALAAILAALAVIAPVASADAQTLPGPIAISPTCPLWYGITNPATGCAPYWAIELGFPTAPYHAWLP
jgi:hypothetical protein